MNGPAEVGSKNSSQLCLGRKEIAIIFWMLFFENDHIH